MTHPDLGFDVLSLEPHDLTARVPPWELQLSAGEIGCAVIDGSAEEWNAIAGRCSELEVAPVITVGMVRDSPSPAAAECDFVVQTDEQLADLLVRISAAPGPTLAVAAQLLRSPSITTESFAYSMLLAAGSFRDWRAANNPRPLVPDHAARRVAVATRDGISILSLTRPEKHNAYDRSMREQLCDALDALTAADMSPIVLLGTGPSFCSGGDLDEFGTSDDPVASHVVRSGRSVARRLQRVADRLVVGVHGHCIGAGVELAAYGRVVIATEASTFSLPELSLGLNLGAGGAVSLRNRIGRRRTLQLLVAAEPIDSVTALDWGLVDEVVAHDELEPRCLARAGALA